MTQRKAYNPAWPWIENFRISQAVQVGDTIYVSGQGPLDSEGQLVGEGDMAAQSRQVFANIRAVLAEAGATMDDVVKITSFITDTGRYAEYAAARAEAFPNPSPRQLYRDGRRSSPARNARRGRGYSRARQR